MEGGEGGGVGGREAWRPDSDVYEPRSGISQVSRCVTSGTSRQLMDEGEPGDESVSGAEIGH